MNDNNIRFEDLTDQGNGANPMAPMPQKNNSFNIVSMVIGILSIVLCCCIPDVGLFICPALGVIAIVLYVVSKRKGINNGMSLAGFICGIIGLVLSVIAIISALVIGYVIVTNPEFSSLYDSISNMQI